MRKPHVLVLALALGAVGVTHIPHTQAQTARAVREQAEASMVLTGNIDIGTAGQVEAFRLDHREKVNPAIAGFLEDAVREWRFEQVIRDGQAVPARTPVSIRLGGRVNPDGTQRVTLLAANFQRYDPDATDEVTRLDAPPPKYPEEVFQMGGSGDVLLLVQVGRDGRVRDVAAEQVNLRVALAEQKMRRMRDKLATISVAAARRWTFRAPTTGPLKDEASWTVRVPVKFSTGEERGQGYGRWQAYIPGPRQQAPWRADKVLGEDAAALLPAGGVYMADSSKGPQLLTPLGG